ANIPQPLPFSPVLKWNQEIFAMSSTPIQFPPDSTLSPAQLRVAEAIARGVTVVKAAEDAGVHRTTVYYWINNSPLFCETLSRARDRYLADIQAQFASLAQPAIDVIDFALHDASIPIAIRLHAALTILARLQPRSDDHRTRDFLAGYLSAPIPAPSSAAS
ncbi:MAG: hypothetical protein ACRD96_18115, partial [Bryobacteraceae bacterium]